MNKDEIHMTKFLSLNNNQLFINVNAISTIEADYCQGYGTNPLLTLKVTLVNGTSYYLSSDWDAIQQGKSEILSKDEFLCTPEDMRKIKDVLDIPLWLNHSDDK